MMRMPMQVRMTFWLLAALVGLSGCAGLGQPGPAAPAGKGGLSSVMEARRMALEAANQSSGISVLASPNGQLQINLPSDFSFNTDAADIKASMRPLLDTWLPIWPRPPWPAC